MIKFNNLVEKNNHIITESKGQFSVIEHVVDLSVSPENAFVEYYMKEMNVRKKQLMVYMNENLGCTIQSGAMQWMSGSIKATTGIKGAGDLIGKMMKGAMTTESTIKPEYKGNGILMLEPTYKYILLEAVDEWASGLVMEDGLFLACDETVKQKLQARSNVSSAILGSEGLFNLKLVGNGMCALESNVPRAELVEVLLENDSLSIDGSFAVCWSGSLDFTVARSGRSLVGSAASGEGFVNVYSGTGRILLSPLTPTKTLYSATHNVGTRK